MRLAWFRSFSLPHELMEREFLHGGIPIASREKNLHNRCACVCHDHHHHHPIEYYDHIFFLRLFDMGIHAHERSHARVSVFFSCRYHTTNWSHTLLRKSVIERKKSNKCKQTNGDKKNSTENNKINFERIEWICQLNWNWLFVASMLRFKICTILNLLTRKIRS